MKKPHISRHFLGAQGTCVRLIPFAPRGSDNVAHKIVTVGAWNQDAEVSLNLHPSFADLEKW
jgi:hypothetical protein